MRLGTATIQHPSRFVSVVLPLAEGAYAGLQSLGFDLVSDTGERVNAQPCIVGRYADGSVQAVQLVATFDGTPPKSVEVFSGTFEPRRFTGFTPATTKAARWMMGLDYCKTEESGEHMLRLRTVARSGPLDFVAWWTLFKGSDAIRCDLVLHNARPGAAPLALAKVALPVPDGYEWQVTQLPEPLMQFDELNGGGEVLYFPARARRIVRGTVGPVATNGSPDLSVCHDEGWGVVKEAWQRETALGAIQAPLPDFGKINVAGHMLAEADKADIALLNGTSWPSQYPTSKRYGLWHPARAKEGGETSGDWITQLPGATLAAAGTGDALVGVMLEQRMVTDRCHIGIVEVNGQPAKLEDYAAVLNWRMRADDARFDKQGQAVIDGPFAFSKAVQLPAGTAVGQAEVDAYEPIDFAHLIRSMRSSVALAWLANDPISKWLIRQDAENARMSWMHGRLAADAAFVAAHPAKGLHWNRIQGWMCSVMAEAYALGGDPLRARFLPGMAQILDVAQRAVMPSGLITCDTTGKQAKAQPYLGQYGVGVAIQHGLLTRGLQALARASGSTCNISTLEALKGVAFLLHGSNTLWSAAVRPSDPNQIAYASRQFDAMGEPLDSSHPQYDAKPGAAVDSEQTRALVGLYGLNGQRLGYGADVIRAMDMAEAMCGSTPTKALLAMGIGALDSDALLLAFCQGRNMP